MDRVEYRCTFVLEDLTEEAVEVQAGFPVDSQFAKHPYEAKPEDEQGDRDPKVRTVSKADLVSMREIMLATYGRVPPDAVALEFSENQAWYDPRESFSMDDLTTEQRKILAAFDRRIEAGK